MFATLLSNSCITPLFNSCKTYGDQKSFCIILPNLVEEKQQRRRKQSASDMGTTYMILSLSLSPQSHNIRKLHPILIQE
jgi:hypothetical protein